MQLSTHLNTHILTFSESEGRQNLPISSKKAQAILAFLSDPNKPSHFHLLDDYGNFKEAVPRRMIKGVKEIEKSQVSEGMKWVCDCGKKNFMHVWPPDQCECKGNRAKWLNRMIAEQRDLPKAGNLLIKS